MKKLIFTSILFCCIAFSANAQKTNGAVKKEMPDAAAVDKSTKQSKSAPAPVAMGKQTKSTQAAVAAGNQTKTENPVPASDITSTAPSASFSDAVKQSDENAVKEKTKNSQPVNKVKTESKTNKN